MPATLGSAASLSLPACVRAFAPSLICASGTWARNSCQNQSHDSTATHCTLQHLQSFSAAIRKQSCPTAACQTKRCSQAQNKKPSHTRNSSPRLSPCKISVISACNNPNILCALRESVTSCCLKPSLSWYHSNT